MTRVSEDLVEQGAIGSRALFRMGADYTDKTSQLKAGSFLVPEASTMEEIIDIVTRGGQSTCGTEVVYRVGINSVTTQVRQLDPATNRFVEKASFNPEVDETPEDYTRVRDLSDTRYRVAVAEGVTSWQVVNALNGLEVMGEEFSDTPPEGSLAPDSYELTPEMAVSHVITRMTSAQERILADAWSKRASDLPLASPEEALVLASIVEKETGVADERFQVASVFTNRLNRGMKLANRPDSHLWHYQGRRHLGSWTASIRTAPRNTVEHLCDRRTAPHPNRKSRARGDRSGAEPRHHRIYLLCGGRHGWARICNKPRRPQQQRRCLAPDRSRTRQSIGSGLVLRHVYWLKIRSTNLRWRRL